MQSRSPPGVAQIGTRPARAPLAAPRAPHKEAATLRFAAPVDVLWVARYDYQARWVLERHVHDHFQLIHFLDGAGTFFVGERALPIRGPAVALLKPGDAHGLTATTEVRTLDVKFRVPEATLASALPSAIDAGLVPPPPGLAEALERIRIEGEARRPFFRSLCDALLLEGLVQLARGEPAEMTATPLPPREALSLAAPDPLAREVAARIEAQHAGPLSFSQMARELGHSDRHLRARFRRATGTSPSHYLQEVRLARARDLIAFSDYALKQVAELVGLGNIHHFTRTFRRHVGMSPGEWRRRVKEGVRKDVYLDPTFVNRNWTRPA